MLKTLKAELRTRATEQRAQAAAAPGAAAQGRAAAEAARALIAGHLGGGTQAVVLAGYMPMRGEIDPLPVMQTHPGPVCVPVVVGRGRPLVFHRWTPQMPMVEGPFRALIPAIAEELTPGVLLVPLLAFDRRGYRLGYGGGFYDRTLAQLRAAGNILAIGFAHAAQEVPVVPTEPTDAALDVIVTGSEVIWPRQG